MRVWRAFLVAAALGVAVQPARATSNISCTSPDGSTSVDLVVGRLPVLGIVNGSLVAGGVTYSLDDSAANRIIVGQAHDDGVAVRVDFTDPNVERVVASLHLFSAFENDRFAQAGILNVTGVGAWPLVCDEP
ncbi:MAG: hypothetical protein MUC58_03025 [Rhizobiaceae bacterium]|nr:hypothetical protein [Rhizobiaceae bacterium]